MKSRGAAFEDTKSASCVLPRSANARMPTFRHISTRDHVQPPAPFLPFSSRSISRSFAPSLGWSATTGGYVTFFDAFYLACASRLSSIAGRAMLPLVACQNTGSAQARAPLGSRVIPCPCAMSAGMSLRQSERFVGLGLSGCAGGFVS